MTTQRYKSVYFHDFPADSSSRKNIKLAFNDREIDIYESISNLSSYEIRSIIGFHSYLELKKESEKARLPLSTFCKTLLANPRPSQIDIDQLELFPVNNSAFFVDAIHATFRGGTKEPLHDWYPFLEGYSPEFVKSIINSFCPKAERIYDPFAGVGTTPITSAIMGRESFYSEVNPALQFLIQSKTQALSANDADRIRISNRLFEIANDLDGLIYNCEPDSIIDKSYVDTFKDSKYFDRTTYDLVLRTRAFLDSLFCEEPEIANLATIATLASLLPSSLLIRAGDIRYKSEKELLKKKVDFLPYLSERIRKIASDLWEIPYILNKPCFLTADARNIELVAEKGFDAIITSPPYLNGTNYFRNTKIELWFLRCLRNASELSIFRKKAVTAGINDVVRKEPGNELHHEVSNILDDLREKAYDKRIPKMIEMYFSEMGRIFDSMLAKLSKDAVVAIDIGDSNYANVHIPTDKILTVILNEKGFKKTNEIPLRKRLSKGGVPLKQVLLVFRYGNKAKGATIAKPMNPAWKSSWDHFMSDLPHQEPPFSKRNWGHQLHSLCSYQGKMKPSLAHYLVKTFVPENGRLLDPFAGVGTIPFEGSLLGKESFGFEISPAAYVISKAKIERPVPDEVFGLLAQLEDYINSNSVSQKEYSEAMMFGFNRALGEYFEQNTLREILLARKYFLNNPPESSSSCLVLSSLLHILHGNRPYSLSRRSHPITPFAPSGDYEYRPLIGRLAKKVQRSLDVSYPENFVDGTMFFQDATENWPLDVGELDAIITSPPFFDSTRFYLANWMRLWFCGWEDVDFKVRPKRFIDEKQKQSFTSYDAVFRQARERIKPGGVMVLHLGSSKKCDMANELSKIASRWFRIESVFQECVKHCESHGIRDKGSVLGHQYLILT